MASSNREQLFLEMVNSARLDPLGDAARYISSYAQQARSGEDNIDDALDLFNVDGELLLQQFTALTPAQPLAWNENLAAAARLHSEAMIDGNEESHQVGDELALEDRVAARGYDQTDVGENIYAFAQDPLHGHARFMVEWGDGEGAVGGMQNPPKQRGNIMNPDFREIGIGAVQNSTAEDQVGPLVVTQDFGARDDTGPGVFILGVAYNDTDNDDFYSIGEGAAGVAVSVAGGSAVTTEGSGGYVVESELTGLQTITLAFGPFGGMFTFETVFSDGLNIKLDVIDEATLQTSVSGTMSGAEVLRGLGLTGLTLTTGEGRQTIIGTKGDDTLSSGRENDLLDGGLGNDTLDGGGGADTLNGNSGNDLLNGSSGKDTLIGGTGNDTMTGGSSDDTYMVGQSGDAVTELSQQGTDTVQSSISYTLPDHVEKLILTGSHDRSGIGNSLGNTIWGNSGNNLLDGKGGADNVRGGDGADTLIWSSSDVLMDGGSGNSDTLKLSGSDTHLKLTTLANGKIAGIERIDLTGSGDHTVTLNAREVLDLSSTSNTLLVLGRSGDIVHRGSGWKHGADQTISGQSYETYTQGLATLLVDSDISSRV